MPCIKVEEITEGDDYKGPAWMDMARQIYGENGKDNYREIRHFDNGAPYVAGSTARISRARHALVGQFSTGSVIPKAEILFRYERRI